MTSHSDIDIRRRKFTTEDLLALLDEFEIDGVTEVVGTIRIGKGEDCLRLVSSAVVSTRAHAVRKMQQFCAVFPVPRKHGGFRVTRDQVGEMIRHSKRLRESARVAAQSMVAADAVNVMTCQYVEASVLADNVWFQLAAHDTRACKSAICQLIRDPELKSVRVELETAKYGNFGTDITYLLKNLRMWANRADIKLNIRRTATGLSIARLS